MSPESSNITGLPEGFNTLSAHLVVSDAPAAMAFYQKAFGAKETMCLQTQSGQFIHGEMQIGNSTLMLSQECKEWGNASPLALGNTTVSIHLQLEKDVDAAFHKALEAGATQVSPLMDMFWGDRFGVVKDPFGHHWSLATKVRDVPPEELQAGAEACFSASVS